MRGWFNRKPSAYALQRCTPERERLWLSHRWEDICGTTMCIYCELDYADSGPQRRWRDTLAAEAARVKELEEKYCGRQEEA